MNNWGSIVVKPSTSIMDTIKLIDQMGMQIAIVASEEYQLLGTVTDGDIRRAILKNIPLDKPINLVMNPNPRFAKSSDKESKIHSIIKNTSIKHLPIVDENKRIVNIISLDELIKSEKKENVVVLMAGGLGTRLKPLTDNIPKPLLRVGPKPILETTLESFVAYNFSNFYISVNYRADLIKGYFNDGSKWGTNIQYIEENKRLGTAGALSLLPESIKGPIIIMNGDVLTKVNFDELLKFHETQGAAATMCVREYIYQVPYGVVKTRGNQIDKIEEKPSYKFFVNAGIYVLNPEVIDLIPKDEFYDMPTLFEVLNKNKYTTNVFPIHEYWLDIGQIPDYEKANLEFTEVFT
ncbi:nucleotidyltransferase family protein [Bacillus alkalicellulosilyticus]|uniref:nucleotidyltransferase family protein n=1 Tax=Alkalihalobacterium alkalicellulosilyticum TaxID=1912214 RepID=UPI00099789A1|nr:nucleotidyltransferase family protein [Bacillus alkalicellulosilyticus]